jgi:ATP-binding cassette subfamily F protein 3
LEAEMAQLSAEKAKLETLLADPNLYAEPNRERVRVCLLEQGRISSRLEVLETAWLELQQQLEAFEAR